MNHGYNIQLQYKPTTLVLVRDCFDGDVYLHSGHACSAMQRLLVEMCGDRKCDVLCIQETHRVQKAVRTRIIDMRLVAEIPHEQYGRAVLVRSEYYM